MSGLAKVVFNYPLMIPPNFTNIDDKVLKIEVVPGRYSDAKKLKLSQWNITCKVIIIIIIAF
jgi:hypothetical protein